MGWESFLSPVLEAKVHMALSMIAQRLRRIDWDSLDDSVGALRSTLRHGQPGVLLAQAYLARLGAADDADVEVGIAELLALIEGEPPHAAARAGYGWLLAHLRAATIDLDEDVLTRIAQSLTNDTRALESARPDISTGLGVWALFALEAWPARGVAGLIGRVAERLLATVARDGELAWWPVPAGLPGGIHHDLSMARGTLGPAAVLAATSKRLEGPQATQARKVAGAALAWEAREIRRRLDAGAVEGFAPGWGSGLETLAAVGAMASCALGDTNTGPWRAMAAAALARDLPVASTDLGTGVAGGVHAFHRLYRQFGDPAYADAALHRTEILLARLAGELPARPGINLGLAGVALVLGALVAHETPAWDRLFAMSFREDE